MIGGHHPTPDAIPHFSPVSEENFWPSFTDIMMVVVIVFLLSSTVVILHNWGLTKRVQETTELERQAREEVEDLNLRQALLQLELEAVQEKMGDIRQALNLKTSQLGKKERALSEAQASLGEQKSQLQAMQERYQQMQAEIKQTQNVSAEREQELLEVQEELARMQGEQIVREEMYLKVEAQQRQTQVELASLQEEYERIDRKYMALSKPARSPLGKTVVAVRYRKQPDTSDYKINIKMPDAEGFRAVTDKEMHQLLSNLSEQHGENLFVRIVIPLDSNLTYQEGWRFSLDLLRRYDYYYQ